MIPLIVIISIVAVIAFLLSIKVTLKISYTDKLAVYLKILFIKIKLYPQKDKKTRYPKSMSKRKAKKIRDSLKTKKKKPKKVKKKENDEEKESTDMLSILSIVSSFIKHFIRLFTKSIRLKASRINIIVATEDAAKTAITYAAVTQSINLLFPVLDDLKTVKKLPNGKNLSVTVDFLDDKPTLDIDLELYVRIGGALKAVCGAAIHAFKKAVKDQMKNLEKKDRKDRKDKKKKKENK